MKPKILYLHQYFKTPQEGGAIRSFYIAQALAQAGFEVVIITSHNEKKCRIAQIQNFEVRYLPIAYDNHFNTFTRIAAFLKFLFQAYCEAKKISNVRLVYATSTPLTVGITALWLKYWHKKKYIFEVRDLWPQAPIEMRVIRNNLLKKILYWLEKKIYHQAEAVIALSQGIEQYIRQKTNKPVYLIPNMADNEVFNPCNQSQKYVLPQHNFLKDKFVVTYFGTLGKANHLNYLLEIARIAQQRQFTQLFFLIIGKGAEEKKLKAQAQTWQLQNLLFIEHQSKTNLIYFLNLTYATYISFLDLPVLQTTSPNKFFDSLAAGKLCIVNVQGWLKELVEKNECGFYAPPHQPEVFLEKIRPFVQNPNLLAQYQANAQRLAQTQFDKNFLCQKVIEVVKKLTI
ncbi:MAG: glycosyltransferase family 4 protein [Microscillaceae bacterium]|nr:glycosyltransferase family 4 protein [Microscillaceae bacterium]MDW8461746.1 glycosyltransferase family 4 protein [Cytophagales bacterium]